MRSLLRTSISQSLTPGTAVLAAVVAVAAVAAGVLADAVAAPVYAAVSPASMLFFAPLVVEVVVSAAVWIPVAAFALAGFYGGLGEASGGVADSLRAFTRSGRTYYRRYLVGAAAGFVASLALTAVVWLLLVAGYLAASTGFDYVRYAQGARFAANPMWGVAATGLLLAVAGLVASAVVVFTGPLLVRSDVDPSRAPLASAQMLRESPRVALPTAAFAAIVLAVPVGATWLAFYAQSGVDIGLTGDHLLPVLSANSVTLLTAVVATFLAYLVAGPLLVAVTDHSTADRPNAGRSPAGDSPPSLNVLVPGQRAATLALVVLLVGSAAVGVRVADARPHNPPEAGVDLKQAPGEVYADSLDLTRRTSRQVNASVLTHHPNGSLAGRVSFVTAWDAADAQTLVTAHLGEGRDTAAYFSQRVTAFRYPDASAALFQRWPASVGRTTNDWLVAPVPTVGLASRPDNVDPQESFRRDDLPLRVVERTPDRLVLGVGGEEAAALSVYHGVEDYDVRNASFRAVVDPETGYLQRIQLTSTVLERAENGTVVERRSRTRVISYEHVGDTDVRRPEIGDPSAMEYLWDVLWY
jgi:hypothetical protein